MTEREDFAIPYWNWTNQDDRDILFTDEWFGGIDPEGDGLITGYFGSIDTWPIVCLNANSTNLCDPSDRTGQLRRCPSTSECEKTDERWPSPEEVAEAVDMETYDSEPYSRYSLTGFRNQMEGFDHNDCSDEDDILCSGGTRRRLHNTVRFLLCPL